MRRKKMWISRFPRWLKLTFLLTIGVLLYTELFRIAPLEGNRDSKKRQQSNEVSSYPTVFPTKWDGVIIRLDSVSQIEENIIVAQWAYCSTSEEKGFSTWEPASVSLTKIVDSNANQYSVATSNGIALCSQVSNFPNNQRVDAIFRQKIIPVWAKFRITPDAQPPFSLYFAGAEIPPIIVPLLSRQEEIKRAYASYPTSWPNIDIQLEKIIRHPADTIEVRWKYINRDTEQPFSWGMYQSNLIVETKLYNYASGTYHSVAKQIKDGSVEWKCNSINDTSGWSYTIAPGDSFQAYAMFENIRGDHLQILFYRPEYSFQNFDAISSFTN